MSVVFYIPVSSVLLDYKCIKCVMGIFVPSPYIISSTVAIIAVTIVTITIITVYSNNNI